MRSGGGRAATAARSSRRWPRAERVAALSRCRVRSRAAAPPSIRSSSWMSWRRPPRRKRRAIPVIHLEVGQPSTPAPKGALAAARAALDATHRLCRRARPAALRERSRGTIGRYRVEVSPERVVVTTGSSRRLPAGLPGELRCRRPGRARGARLPRLSQHPGRRSASSRSIADLGADRFQPTVRRSEGGAARRPDRGQPVQSDRHDGDARELKRSPTGATRTACRLISDEIYHGIVYDGEAASADEVSDQPSWSTASRSTSR